MVKYNNQPTVELQLYNVDKNTEIMKQFLKEIMVYFQRNFLLEINTAMFHRMLF